MTALSSDRELCSAETLSGVWWLLDGVGILDPCEKNLTDAVGNLTEQQREDLTFAAQVTDSCHVRCQTPCDC